MPLADLQGVHKNASEAHSLYTLTAAPKLSAWDSEFIPQNKFSTVSDEHSCFTIKR